MSKITRRDFLKTAGVMTLAVAAAGVLSGCEGNTAPEKPTNGNLTVGEVAKVDGFEFSVTKAVQQNNVARTIDKTTGQVETEVESATGRLVVTLRNAGDKPADFSYSNVHVYANGKEVAYNSADVLDAAKSKQILGMDEAPAMLRMSNLQNVKPEKKAENYMLAWDLNKDVYNDLEPITKLEVAYINGATGTVVRFDIPTPVAVVEWQTN